MTKKTGATTAAIYNEIAAAIFAIEDSNKANEFGVRAYEARNAIWNKTIDAETFVSTMKAIANEIEAVR